MRIRAIILTLAIALCLTGCKDNGPAPQSVRLEAGGPITTAEALRIFFEDGTSASTTLGADIDMGETMLKLTKARGPITIEGGKHTILSSAASAIRLEDGCALTLNDVHITATHIAIGMLGSAHLSGSGTLDAINNAVYATGPVTLPANSAFTLNSTEGSGILADGLTLGASSKLDITAALSGIICDRGDIVLETGAVATCSAHGDNIVETDGALMLQEKSSLRSTNTGDHNAARIGELIAAPNAMLSLTGGKNGLGLFIVNQKKNVHLTGACTPELKIETGDGIITFTK